jgi:hypothetical protein
MRYLAALALFLTLTANIASANTASAIYTINITAAGGYSGPCDVITGGCVAAHSMSQKMVGAYGGHAFELINSTPAWTGTASISGTTLTVATTTSGAMANGLALSGVGSGFVPAVKPVTYTSGCSGSTCTVSQSQTAASVTAAYAVLDVGFQGNGAWDETTWQNFCAGVTCLVEKIFDQGSGGSANDLIASQISGGSATNLDCTASIVVCAPLFIVDTATDTPMAFTASSEMGLFGDVYSGNSSSGLPAGATDASVMFSGFNVYASACCGGLYGMMEPNPNSIPAGAMYAVGFANGIGSGGPVNCDAATHIGFWMDVEASSDPPGPCPAAIYDTDQFSRGVWEGQYKSGSNTDTGLWNGSVVWGPITPSEPASARQTWMRIGSGGDRSWLAAAFSDGWITTDVGSHAAATTKLRNFYAGRSASTCQGPLDFGWYMPTSGLGETGGGVSAPIFTIGIGMGGWSPRPLSAWYTGPVINVTNNASQTKTFSGVGCNIDPAITAFCSGGNSPCLVNTLFNQAWITAGTTHGNVRQTAEDLSTTGSQRPSLTLASLNGHPTIHFSGAQQLCTTATPLGNYHQTYPIDLATVARRTGNVSAVQYAFTSDVSLNLGFYALANTAMYQVSSTQTKAAADNQWHSLIGHSSSGAGSLYVDNVSSSFSAGTSLFGPTYYCLGGHGGNYLTGDIAEAVMNYTGLFNGATTYAGQTYTNDIAYWQFMGSGAVVNTEHLLNKSASATPGGVPFPANVYSSTKPGVVPSGNIAVPSINGSAIPYEAYDCASPWGDGSQRGCAYALFVPQLAGNATEQVTWTSTPGSYITTSSTTPANVTALGDYKLQARGVNTTWVNTPVVGTQVGFATSAGAVTSGTVRIAAPAGGVYGVTCADSAQTCITPSTNSYVTSGAPGSGTTLTFTTNVAKAIYNAGNTSPLLTHTSANYRNLIIYDTTTPSAIPKWAGTGYIVNGTLFVSSTISGALQTGMALTSSALGFAPTYIQGPSGGNWSLTQSQGLVGSSGTPVAFAAYTSAFGSGGTGNTVNLSNPAPSIGSGDTIVFAYPVQGCGVRPPAYTFTLDGNNNIASVNIYDGGAGCLAVGSGNQTFDPNILLNAYAGIKPPMTTTETGSATFTGTVSGTSLTTSGVTGPIAINQLVRDSTGAVAVITAGSGSSWTLSATLTSGPMTSSCPVQMYADGPVMTGYRISGPFLDDVSGLPDPWHRARVDYEYWHQGGATDSLRAIAKVDDAIYTPNVNQPGFTYDFDARNGTALIRGNSAGAGIYSRITMNVSGAWYTGDPLLSGPVGGSGKPDWLGVTPNAFSETFSAGINSVIVSLTTADKVFWHANHAHMPLDNAFTAVTPAVIPNSGTYGYPTTWQGYYEPYGVNFIDRGGTWEDGGEHFFLAPDGAHLPFWYFASDAAGDGGASWLQQTRVAAISLDGVQQGPRWDLTGHDINVDPAWATPPAAFTDPPYLFSNRRTGYDNRSFGAAGPCCSAGTGAVDMGQLDHYPIGLPLAIYSVEGDRYLLDEIDDQAQNAMNAQFDDFGRTAKLGSTQFYALYYGESAPNRRANGWSGMGITTADIFLPPGEADQLYWHHVVQQNNLEQLSIQSFVGTIGRGCNGSTSCTSQNQTGTKQYDTSAIGVDVSASDWTSYGGLVDIAFPTFMEAYVGEAVTEQQMWYNSGGVTDSNLNTLYANFVGGALVGAAAANTCVYDLLSYTKPWGSSVDGKPFTNWDGTNISTGDNGNVSSYTAGPIALDVVSGSTIAAASTKRQPGSYVLNLTAASTPSGSTINISGSTSGAFKNAIVADVTTPGAIPYGTYINGTPGASTLPISASISGITAGDTIAVSTLLDYPTNSGFIFPSGTLVRFTNLDNIDDVVPNPAGIGPFPPSASPAVDDHTQYVWCLDPSGAAKGTLNPPGTNCASPSPITFTATGTYQNTFIVNASCPPVTAGTWNNPAPGADYQNPQERIAQYYAISNGANALNSTSNTLAAISHTFPSVSPLNTTFVTNPRLVWAGGF